MSLEYRFSRSASAVPLGRLSAPIRAAGVRAGGRGVEGRNEARGRGTGWRVGLGLRGGPSAAARALVLRPRGRERQREALAPSLRDACPGFPGASFEGRAGSGRGETFGGAPEGRRERTTRPPGLPAPSAPAGCFWGRAEPSRPKRRWPWRLMWPKRPGRER